jgi:hypothetical protein
MTFLSEGLANKKLSQADWVVEVRDCAKKQFFVNELKKKVIRAIRSRKMGRKA